MPRYKKPGTGRDFQPGNNANPHGRPKDPPELKALKKLNKANLDLLLNKLLQAKPDELKGMNNTVLELWLASGASKGIQKGEFTNLVTLIERLIGKVPVTVGNAEGEGFKIIVEDYKKKE